MTAIQNAIKRTFVDLPRSPRFWSITVGHLTNDIFMSMGPVLLTFISENYYPTVLTAAVYGLVLSIREVTGALSQPLFGFASDRTGGRYIGSFGVMWVALLLALSLLILPLDIFWLFAAVFALSPLGSGAFHPVGVKYATEIEKRNEAGNIAIFFVFGQTGLALGPAIAGLMLDGATSEVGLIPAIRTPFAPIILLGLVALPIGLFMMRTLPSRKAVQVERLESQKISVAVEKKPLLLGPLILIGLVILFRAIANYSAANFMPVLFARKGWEPAAYGLIASSFWIASALGNLFIGKLSDRFTPRLMIALTMALSIPAFFLIPLSDGAPAFVLALLIGLLLGGTHSTMVLLAQHVIPTGRGFSGGTILSFMFMSGAVGNVLTGALADGFKIGGLNYGGMGLASTFQVMAGVALLTALLTMLLPARIGKKDPEPSEPSPAS